MLHHRNVQFDAATIGAHASGIAFLQFQAPGEEYHANLRDDGEQKIMVTRQHCTVYRCPLKKCEAVVVCAWQPRKPNVLFSQKIHPLQYSQWSGALPLRVFGSLHEAMAFAEEETAPLADASAKCTPPQTTIDVACLAPTQLFDDEWLSTLWDDATVATRRPFTVVCLSELLSRFTDWFCGPRGVPPGRRMYAVGLCVLQTVLEDDQRRWTMELKKTASSVFDSLDQRFECAADFHQTHMTTANPPWAIRFNGRMLEVQIIQQWCDTIAKNIAIQT